MVTFVTMKTNVVLKGSDRELFGVRIRQSTNGHMLSVTDLQKAYEKGKWSNGWIGQTYNQLLQTDNLAKKCYGVLLECGLINCDVSKFMEMVEKETLVKVLKGLGVWKTTGRGENKTVMAHPYVWMSVAIELNYVLYGKVIKWVTDSLIFDRIEAGNEFLPMNAAIKSVVSNPDYRLFARAINESVFGEHQTGMRNMASSSDLRKITEIEKFVKNAIEKGWIKTEQQILDAIKSYK